MKEKPSDLELQILSILWENSPLTVKAILAKMPDGKKRAYTTILSTVQKMEQKGFLAHESQGKTHLFYPLLSQKKTLGDLMKEMVKHVFGGKVTNVMQTLLSEEVSAEEINELKQLLDESQKENK